MWEIVSEKTPKRTDNIEILRAYFEIEFKSLSSIIVEPVRFAPSLPETRKLALQFLLLFYAKVIQQTLTSIALK